MFYFDIVVSHLFNLIQGHSISKLQFRIENFTVFVRFNTFFLKMPTNLLMMGGHCPWEQAPLNASF
jgi:hypothetical protein